ncbi:MAG TPA: ABC transporter ATP-binding protein [Acidimicrobiia bacterium]|jgi:branched-chain amino acid transport system ATP-binding protein|nr:ABC transporter ATP-binding protein [Acidimicrobiia bacterium]
MLEVEGVSTGYGRLPVLFDVSLTVGAGEMVALLGPNGAGKSTLLKTILGMLPVRSGSLTFEGRRLTAAPANERFAAGISLCPEGRRIFKNLTVRENLLAGSCSVSRQDAAEQLDVCYDLFPILGQRQRQRAGSLSGGEQQMAAVARALMSRPRLLLVDELSMGLAPIVVSQLLESLRALCDRGLGLIVVEQHAARMIGFADRGVLLEKGQIAFTGPLLDAERRMEETYMGEPAAAGSGRRER